MCATMQFGGQAIILKNKIGELPTAILILIFVCVLILFLCIWRHYYTID